jgi:hypothetical protein
MLDARQLVNKVWSLCNLLRDDGITYQDYITELSWLLYLCLASKWALPNRDDHLREAWPRLVEAQGGSQLELYSHQLQLLASSPDVSTAKIFAGAATSINNAAALHALIREIDVLDWARLSRQTLGDIYEGILERNATEQKSGAGQYFTPRIVVELMVRVISPKSHEIVQDPAAGTGGFLVCAYAHAMSSAAQSSHTDGEPSRVRYFGVELVPSAYRLCIMNVSLHAVPAQILQGNSLGPLAISLPRPDYRPKGRIYEEDDTREGYWWLALASTNFRLSCKYCNERRVDRSGGTAGGKGTHFPLLQDGMRASSDNRDLDRERPAILDPIRPLDPPLLKFLQDSWVQPAHETGEDPIKHERADITIGILHLNHGRLRFVRGQVCNAVQEAIERTELAYRRYSERKTAGASAESIADAYGAYESAFERLAAYVKRTSPYAGAAKSIIRQQAEPRGEWLETILSL